MQKPDRVAIEGGMPKITFYLNEQIFFTEAHLLETSGQSCTLMG